MKPAHTHRYEFTSTSSAVATDEQRNCRSSGKVMNLQIVLDLLSGEMSPMAKWWTTKTTARRGVAVGSPSYEIDRDVGEHDATRRHMTTNDAATYAMTQNGTNRQRGRAGLIALWLTQVALALMFLMAGGSKLVGVPAMVILFGALGLGQWFRYVTCVVE